jgi:hypothetical protein
MLCLAGAPVWASLLLPTARAGDARADAELVCEVQEILHHHCRRCHIEAAKGGVRVLDRTLLVRQRQVVRPCAPDASELLDLVEGGSMPPGNLPKVPREDQRLLRKWIEVGAPALPGQGDDSFILWSIARDWGRLGDKQTSSWRYVSLNHGLPDERRALERVLRHLAAEDSPAPILESIERTGTVFRMDLWRLGWYCSLYKDARWNLFDLVLLKYQDGRWPNLPGRRTAHHPSRPEPRQRIDRRPGRQPRVRPHHHPGPAEE